MGKVFLTAGVSYSCEGKTDDTYTVTAMKETIERSNIGLLKVGDKVNVERNMMMNGRLTDTLCRDMLTKRQLALILPMPMAVGISPFSMRLIVKWLNVAT